MQWAEVLGLLVIGNRCHVSDSRSLVQVLFLYFAFMETAWTLCPSAVSEWRFRKDLKGLCTNTILEFKASSQVCTNPQGKEETSRDTELKRLYSNLFFFGGGHAGRHMVCYFPDQGSNPPSPAGNYCPSQQSPILFRPIDTITCIQTSPK